MGLQHTSRAVAVALVGLTACDGSATSPTPQPLHAQTFTIIGRDLPFVVPNVPPPALGTAVASGIDGLLTDVQVSVEIRGASICDLSLWLEHPDGTSVTLLAVDRIPPGLGCGRELKTTFPTLTPTPDAKDLTILRGKGAIGTWKLHVADEGGHLLLDQFTVYAWMLTLTVQR